jgi:hypothetical protein
MRVLQQAVKNNREKGEGGQKEVEEESGKVRHPLSTSIREQEPMVPQNPFIAMQCCNASLNCNTLLLCCNAGTRQVGGGKRAALVLMMGALQYTAEMQKGRRERKRRAGISCLIKRKL